ncbi:error-prone DNA polymerase [Janthinobacterium sp. PLB04]|uniref:Error-prone DNA polymerase n=1 Tax=Janthinobacterium lividum TaxID=29581 RepID=A0AAJ4MP99_9BURK|nr:MULTISPECIES: error-prone DNA polymerase [Janthinobacterium]KAB0325486.1 error-prone DNA polymerase [Janthinobacterium lividum]QSX94589.1 error-prone DNA polymerase [Janthinobacterium lividum]UGQ34401.1 error-prone DNA polymerase [Janthinobacterium sp. PLB04]
MSASYVPSPGPVLPDYAELQVFSHYTFLRGASAPEQLVARAAKLGYAAVAITDECTLAGVVKAHIAAKELGIHLVIGSQMTVTPEDGSPPFVLIILATNKNGYGNLSELITVARTRTEKGSYLVLPRDIAMPVGDLVHLRCLPDCQFILAPKYNASYEEIERQAAWLIQCVPGRARIALTLHHRAQDEKHRQLVFGISEEFGMPVVATGDVCMHVRSYKPLQDTMTAIRHGVPVAQCGYRLAPNAEQHLRSRVRLGNLYSREALDESVRVAQLCEFSLDELRYEYPQELVPDGETATSYLRKEAYIGAHWRFPAGVPENVQALLERELGIIAELQYESYFLTVFDIVRFARSQHILCQGRGSAANSAVCYCLGVTEVDPSRGTLLFERFISKERNEPPDIDIDFEHQRREEVIQYIYKKYGRMRAALTAVVISYRPRSVLRDVGKALGVDLSVVDKVAKASHGWGGKSDLQERLVSCGFDPNSPIAEKWAELADRLMRFPRHLSQHPGGFVISHTKLSRLVPIENAAMAERSIIQWDKDDIDAVGLLKVDVLALGMLSCIRRALDLVSEQRGARFELGDVPAEDPATYEMICQADTVGVFQIESRAQMSMLPRLQPRTFYDLVIEVAIIRPGPIQGGMIHPFLRRRQGIDPVSYPSPEIESVLERTLGIPIFQEQVMQIAMVAAGFSPGEADALRRAMAAWKRKGGLEQFEDKLMHGMAERGYTTEFATSIIGQIRGFAEYGFPESHAASFALLAYASSWLKCHEPAAFLTALLNSQPMGFYSRSSLVQDACRHGVEVRPVDVSVSNWDAQLEFIAKGSQPAVRLGLNNIKGLEQEAAWRIEEARAIQQFETTADLASRANLSAGHLNALASANALESLSGNRRQALWEAVASVPDKGLLRSATVIEEPVKMDAPSEAENIVADYRHLGLTLGRHPLALLRPRLAAMKFLPAEILNQFDNGRLARGCGIVTVRQRPETAKGVIFVTIEDESGTVNVICWPNLVEQQRKELMGAKLLGVYGVWQCERNVRHLVAKRLVDLSHMLGELDTKSRNFH